MAENSASSPFLLALTTLPSKSDADALAQALIEKRLAACINLMPVQSHFRWEGAPRKESEVLMLIKTTQAQLKVLQQQVLSSHPYQLPEFITLPITGGSEAYLKWMQSETV